MNRYQGYHCSLTTSPGEKPDIGLARLEKVDLNPERLLLVEFASLRAALIDQIDHGGSISTGLIFQYNKLVASVKAMGMK